MLCGRGWRFRPTRSRGRSGVESAALGAGDLVPEALGLADEAGRLWVLLLAAALGELGEQLLLARGQARRRLDEHLDHQVAALARAQGRHAAALEADGAAGLGAFGDADLEPG